MSMLKANGRLERPKTVANKQIRVKHFVCPACGEDRTVSDVEFGSKYTCPKCGRELLEAT